MPKYKLDTNCGKCRGTGTVSSYYGGTEDCPLCFGDGLLTVGELDASELDAKIIVIEEKALAIDARVATVEGKVATLESKVDDIMDKCIDIKEKVDEIKEVVDEL